MALDWDNAELVSLSEIIERLHSGQEGVNLELEDRESLACRLEEQEAELRAKVSLLERRLSWWRKVLYLPSLSVTGGGV
ncbi:MAG: hypothetical protein WC640_01285 [Candidatus Paceibacterota bacterium]|jgi:hypothetical protein